MWRSISGIDSLEKYWTVFPSLRSELFEPGDRPGYSEARIAAAEVKRTILEHPEFATFQKRIAAVFDQWWTV
jgi:type I restriction enzyme M protein